MFKIIKKLMNSRHYLSCPFECLNCKRRRSVQTKLSIKQSHFISVSATRFLNSIIFDFLPEPRNLLPRDWLLLSQKFIFFHHFAGFLLLSQNRDIMKKTREGAGKFKQFRIFIIIPSALFLVYCSLSFITHAGSKNRIKFNLNSVSLCFPLRVEYFLPGIPWGLVRLEG